MKPSIGFIGQGWIGKNYADEFEERGFSVTRFAKEKPHAANKEKIKQCDIVFIAVPTPQTPKGFDAGILREVVPLVGKKKIAVIKSTVLPGTTEEIAKENPDVYVIHSPEFLTESTAAYDVRHPERNIIGIPKTGAAWKKAANAVMEILPKASHDIFCTAKEAELVKYGGNCFFYSKVIFMNMLYDLSGALGCDWEVVRGAMSADKRIGGVHMQPVHQGGRGAGGHCFIKDFEAFSLLYKKLVKDPEGILILESLRDKNIKLLTDSGKDLELLRGVYGENVAIHFKKSKSFK